jgi:predicted dehydrogenase
VGVAIVGAGKISEQYLPNLTQFPDVHIVFIADLLPDRARKAAVAFDVDAYGTVEQALQHDGVELIINLTIPAAHADVASAALRSGKHVWNEKPLSMDRESAIALVEQAESAGLLLGCAPDTFLSPGFQAVRRMVDAGDIGRPVTASVVFQSPGPHTWHPSPDFLFQAGGGPLLDMGPYYLTVLSQVLGSMTSVAARAASVGPTRTIATGPRAGESFQVTVPTYVTAIYDFDTGAIAAGTFSFDSPLLREGVVEIAGTEATLAAPNPNQFGGDIRLMRSGDDRWRTFSVDGVEGGRGIGVVDMARALRGNVPHRATGRLGLHVLDAMLATVESIEQRAFVPVSSRLDDIPALPEGWDPTERTL